MSSLFFYLSVDAKEFMLGNVTFFENVEISKGDVYKWLILLSNILDELTKHLEDGKYSNPRQQFMRKTASVGTTNSIAERNSGMHDKFMSEKPNAKMITFESLIKNRTNKTPEWQKKLTPEKRSLMMK